MAPNSPPPTRKGQTIRPVRLKKTPRPQSLAFTGIYFTLSRISHAYLALSLNEIFERFERFERLAPPVAPLLPLLSVTADSEWTERVQVAYTEYE